MDSEIKKDLTSNWFKLLQNIICDDISKLEKNKTNFMSKMLEIVFDHRVPLFKGGSDDNTNLDNWQVLSWYVNNEKNKVCKNCYENNCDDCALAYPENSEKIKPTNQNLKDLLIF